MARKKLSAPERRAQLINVGRKLFAEKGFEASTVEELAHRAGITKPIVYQHFGGKDGLYAVIVEEEMDRVVRLIASAIGEGTPRERTENGVRAFFDYVVERPEGFAVLSHDAPVDSGRGCMSSLISDLAERVGGVFAKSLAQAGLDPASAPIYGHALVGMVSFVGQWWVVHRETHSVEVVAGHLNALAWLGLRHLPPTPKVLE